MRMKRNFWRNYYQVRSLNQIFHWIIFTPQGYNPLARPVKNASEMLVVKMKMFLQQVLDVDEREQLVSINAWLSYVCLLTLFI